MVDAQNAPGIDELRLAQARTEGQLAAVASQLAASVAAEEQLRIELAAGHDTAAQRRIADLEEQLAEARRSQARAEEERAAITAALGRQARKALEHADS